MSKKTRKRKNLGYAREESHLGAYLLAGGIAVVFVGGIYAMIRG